MLGMRRWRRPSAEKAPSVNYKFFEDPPAHIQNDLQPSFIIMRNILEMAWNVPFLTLQSVHTSKALFHVLISHAIFNSQVDHDYLDRGLYLQRHVGRLDDLFDEMNAIPYGVHPPLDQWQVRLDGLFESLCTTNNGSEEVRRSKILMKSLKDADWRKLDISTNEETTRKDQTPAGDSSNGRLPYILYTSRGNVDDMVPSIQLEPPSSPEFMNPPIHDPMDSNAPGMESFSGVGVEATNYTILKSSVDISSNQVPLADKPVNTTSVTAPIHQPGHVVFQEAPKPPNTKRLIPSLGAQSRSSSSSRTPSVSLPMKQSPMTSISRIIEIGGRRGSNSEHRSAISKLLVASRGAIGVPYQDGPEMNSSRKLSGSTESDSSYDTHSGDSLFENSVPRSLSEESTLSSLASPKPKLDPSLAVFSGVRHDHVEDVTTRLTVSWNRPFFEGGYSNVWMGTIDNTQLVAIKGLKDQKIRPAKPHRILKRAVGTWWCLRHENIIPLLGLAYNDTFGSFGAMVSPWYMNGSAATYLSNPERPVSIAGRIDLFSGVATGLHYLHTFDTTKITEEPATASEHEYNGRVTGIVHGDLKPLNVLVDDNGVAKLCDFGLLHLIRENSPTGVTATPAHTGATRYLCYELVAKDENPTTASDVHALASVGLEFLYSMPPYANIHSSHMLDYKIIRAIEDKVPPAVRPKGISGVTSTLWDALEHCWSIEPKDRPDAQAICDYLQKNRSDLIAAMRQ